MSLPTPTAMTDSVATVAGCDPAPLDAASSRETPSPQPIQRPSRSSTITTQADEKENAWNQAYSDDEWRTKLDARPWASARAVPRSARGSWFARVWTAIVLVTSIYSTVMSGLWFVMAVTQYQYQIGQKNTMSFNEASTIITALAKTIELSFELVSVAVVGQELTRRLTTPTCNGINLAQMQIKAFLAQPGSCITNWQAFFHVAPTPLGLASLFIAAVGILYSTASDALVAPSIAAIGIGVQPIPAYVNTNFLNVSYMENSCPAQMTNDQDPFAMSSCDSVRQMGFVYHNMIQYLQNFEQKVSPNKKMAQVRHRPKPVALFNQDNQAVAVRGAWKYSSENGKDLVVYNETGRVVNNITILLPHAGVVAAARQYSDSLSLQDQNYGNMFFQGSGNAARSLGTLRLSASVITPAINVHCASLAEDDPTLAAIVVSNWTAAQNASVKPNMSKVLNTKHEAVKSGWYNGSEFDSHWKFSAAHRPPAFPNLPGANNTRISWSQDTNGTSYLLARAQDDGLFMCSMTVQVVHNCSTEYHSASQGGVLELNCDPDNAMAYSSPYAPASFQHGFVEAANHWSLSMALGSTTDDDSSLAHVLAELWQSSGQWNSSKPSVAEALGVLASSILLNAAVDAPLHDVDQLGQAVGESTSMTQTTTAKHHHHHSTTNSSSTASFFSTATSASISSTSVSTTPTIPLPSVTATAQQLIRLQPTAVRAGTEHQRRNAHDSPTQPAPFAKPTQFNAQVEVSVYSAGPNTPSQNGFFVVLMGAFVFNLVFLVYIIATLIVRHRSTAVDLGADAEGAGTWTLRADLADPQALFGLALNSRPDSRLADAMLAPLPRKAMSQRWSVAGGKYSVFIRPIGRRRSSLRRAMSSTVGSVVGSVSQKSSSIRKGSTYREREIV